MIFWGRPSSMALIPLFITFYHSMVEKCSRVHHCSYTCIEWVSVNSGGRGGRAGHPVRILWPILRFWPGDLPHLHLTSPVYRYPLYSCLFGVIHTFSKGTSTWLYIKAWLQIISLVNGLFNDIFWAYLACRTPPHGFQIAVATPVMCTISTIASAGKILFATWIPAWTVEKNGII